MPPAWGDLLSRTSSWANRLTAFLPNMRSVSGDSSDSGFHSLKQSQPNSRTESRRTSVTELELEDRTDSEDELLSHVNVFPGVDVNDSYDLKHLLGDGAFSKVYLAESRKDSGGFAAVKIIDKEELCKDEDKMFLVDKEIEIMSQLDHPNIVRLYEVYESKTEVCLVMELAKGGELFDRLLEHGCLAEQEAGRLMAQVLEALLDLHSRRIVHRDLKPENLLFYDNTDNSKIVVVDFGLSEYEEELNEESPVCGTATYLAPEVIAQTESSRAQDLWSCGVITYIMLSGYPPFFKNQQDKSETKLLRQIVKGKYQFHDNFWGHISEEAKHFVSRLMCSDPKLRLTVEEAINHPWIVRYKGWRCRDSGLWVLAKSALVMLVMFSIFVLYFLMLSGYFDIEDHFFARFWHAVCSLKVNTTDFLNNIYSSVLSAPTSLIDVGSVFIFNSEVFRK